MAVDAGLDAGLRGMVLPRVQELSPTLRLAADYVLKNPDVVAMHSLRKVAEITDLNPPTFTRLARSLGLQNYEALRELCRQEIQQNSGSFADKAASLQRRQSSAKGAFLPAHAAASIVNIENLVETTDPGSLAQAADLLAKARNVVLVGSLSSAALIDYLSYMARMAFPHWRSVLRNHETPEMGLSELGPHDAMIVLAHKPYASHAVEAAERVRRAGVPVVAVTDSYAAPIAVDAAHVFVTPTNSPHFFASAVPLVVLFEALLSMVVRRGGRKTRERIAAIERENHRSGAYWQG
ncbi:MAG: MurR/RpiR family transcriptional regulator [Hyphomicrobiaceae bacterium]